MLSKLETVKGVIDTGFQIMFGRLLIIFLVNRTKKNLSEANTAVESLKMIHVLSSAVP